MYIMRKLYVTSRDEKQYETDMFKIKNMYKLTNNTSSYE